MRKTSQAIIDDVSKLAESGASRKDISDETGLSMVSVANIIQRYKISMLSPSSLEQRYPNPVQDEVELEKERDRIFRKYKGRAMNILSLGDLHYPNQNNTLIKQAMQEEFDAVVASEVWDFYGLSRFRKNKTSDSEKELQKGTELIREIKGKKKDFIWFKANHERRLESLLMDRLTPEAVRLIGIGNLIKNKVEGVGCDATNSWWVKIGNVIFAHPDWFTNSTLKTAEATQDNFLKYDRKLWASTDCIVNHHTHKLGMSVHFGQTIMETGSGCIRMDYLNAGKMRLEMHKGYGIIRIEKDGSFNFNKSRLVKVD